MIELRDLQKTFTVNNVPIPALTDINLSVDAGEIFGVIGSSGAGKSTLIRCINLLEQPSAGQVIIDSESLTQLNKQQLRQARRKIGMIFQNFNLLSSRNVYENIAFPLELAGIKKQKIKQKVKEFIELTGLKNKENYYPSQLSGGQKQRVAIARALANEPKVLLSDEATSSLDPENTHAVLQLLKNINQQLGVTILLITHEMNVVKEICNRLAILDHGRILEQAEVLQFFSNPRTELAKKFIRSIITHNLPEYIQQRLVDEPSATSLPLLRISFLGKAAEEPLIATLARDFSLPLNILQANIEQIRDESIGVMLVTAHGNAEKLAAGIAYLAQHNVKAEVIGYVR